MQDIYMASSNFMERASSWGKIGPAEPLTPTGDFVYSIYWFFTFFVLYPCKALREKCS